ncbi:MAG: lytic transglycosylase domain-containing protein [Gammaproteobacteria bacterium]
MQSNPFRLFPGILSLAVSMHVYADYDITINMNGQEYYSNANGSSNKEAVSVDGDGSISVNMIKPRSAANRAGSRKPYSGVNRKGPKKYDRLVAEAADKHQVDPRLVHAVIQAESAYNEQAVSSAGAAGLMQLMPGTARQYGVSDRFDPYQNIDGGTRYLKHLVVLFNEDLNLALAAYNAGENAVIRHHNRIPPYAETQHYVKEVLALQNGRKPGIQRSSNPFVSWSDSDYSWDSAYP